MNVLSQLTKVTSKSDFFGFLVRGFASNFPPSTRSQIANHIYSLAGEKPPVDLSRNPLDFSIADGSLRMLAPIASDFSLSSDFTDLEEPPVSRTVGLQRDVEVLKPWVTNAEPFIVCGN